MAEVDVFWVNWTVLGWIGYTKWVVYVWFAISLQVHRPTQLSLAAVRDHNFGHKYIFQELVPASNIGEQVPAHEVRIERHCTP